MQTAVRALLYTVVGLVAGAILFCGIALLPLNLNQQDAAVAGAVAGAVLGFVFGLTRRFQ